MNCFSEDTGVNQEASHSDAVLHLRVLEKGLRLEFVHSSSRDLVAAAWSRSVTAAGNASDHVLRLDSEERPVTEADLGRVTSLVVSEVLDALEGSWLVLRAFAVAAPDGQVVLLASRRGEDALSAGLRLSREGFGYVTDQTLVVGLDGSVLPCPRPVSLVEDVEGVPRTVLRGADSLGVSECAAPLRLRSVLMLEGDDEDGTSALLGPLGLMDALAVMAPLLSPHAEPDRPLQRLCGLVTGCGVVGVSASGGADLAEVLASQLDHEAAVEEEWHPSGERPSNAMAWGIRDGRLRPGPWIDAVDVGGEAMVLAAGKPVRLGPLGRTIWRVSRNGARLADVVAAAIAEHGAHPQAAELVDAAVTDLRESGVVTWSEPQTLEAVLGGALRRRSG